MNQIRDEGVAVMTIAWFSEINGFDIVIYLIFLGFLARGLWLGFISQIAFIIAMIFGFVLAGNLHSSFYPVVLPVIKNEPAAFWLTYIILFVAIYFAIMVLGLGLKKVMHITLLGWFDRVMGGVFGLTKALFISCLLFMALTSVLGAGNGFLRKAASFPLMERCSSLILFMISDRELRDIFIPKELAINPKAQVVELSGEEKRERVSAAVEAVVEAVIEAGAKHPVTVPDSRPGIEQENKTGNDSIPFKQPASP